MFITQIEKTLISNYATIFQLVGGILLAYSFITRKRVDIKRMCSSTILINGMPFPGLSRILFETYISLCGFIYFTLGYGMQLFSEQTYNIVNRFFHPIIKILLINLSTPLLAIPFTFYLIFLSVIVTKIIAENVRTSYNLVNFNDPDLNYNNASISTVPITYQDVEGANELEKDTKLFKLEHKVWLLLLLLTFVLYSLCIILYVFMKNLQIK